MKNKEYEPQPHLEVFCTQCQAVLPEKFINDVDANRAKKRHEEQTGHPRYLCETRERKESRME